MQVYAGGLRWDKWSCSAQCRAAEGRAAFETSKRTQTDKHTKALTIKQITTNSEEVSHQLNDVLKAGVFGSRGGLLSDSKKVENVGKYIFVRFLIYVFKNIC